jgi:hypothetical protein
MYLTKNWSKLMNFRSKTTWVKISLHAAWSRWLHAKKGKCFCQQRKIFAISIAINFLTKYRPKLVKFDEFDSQTSRETCIAQFETILVYFRWKLARILSKLCSKNDRFSMKTIKIFITVETKRLFLERFPLTHWVDLVVVDFRTWNWL